MALGSALKFPWYKPQLPVIHMVLLTIKYPDFKTLWDPKHLTETEKIQKNNLSMEALNKISIYLARYTESWVNNGG